jgi:D-alanyl-D-alanine carboxypeptidase
VLAGLILDTALGYHHSKAIRSRIVEPLQLTSTCYACYDDCEGEIVHGYADIDRDGILDDISSIDQGHCLADAGLLSTVGDLAVFIESLFTSGFPDPGYKTTFMNALLPEGDDFYGLGILKYPTAYGTAYGNGGHFIGYESGVMYFPDHGVTIVYFVNSTGPRSNRIVDDFLDRLLKKVMNS